MRASLGQTIIIENVSGANGSIGVGRVARAAPDGYTLSIGQTATHVINAVTYTLPYHVLNDFEPISLLTDSPLLIVAKKAMPANDLGGFIAWLKANPDKAMLGPQVSEPYHMSAVCFFRRSRGPASCSFRTVAALRQCRLWWPVKST